MYTPTYTEVFAYAARVEQTGQYSRDEMEAILAARYLYRQDWLARLKEEGPPALSTLREKDENESLRMQVERLGSLVRSLFSWLLGDDFDEAHVVLRDVLDNLYGLEESSLDRLSQQVPQGGLS